MRSARKPGRSDESGLTQRGRVVAAHGRHYVVMSDEGERLVCFTRGKKSELACGDFVEILRTAPGQGVIDAIEPRRNLLSRSNGFRTKRLAANIDAIAIVVATSPPFSEELLGRTLLAAESIDVPARILLNKMDLAERREAARTTLSLYRTLGYAVDELSIRHDPDDTRTRVAPAFENATTLLVGQSGMGKSSLLNLLVPDAQAATREISEALQTGKHTTTDARLYRLPSGTGDLIDTPGFQEFGLAHLTPGTVERGFRELRPFIGQCRFANCMHLREPGCAVLAARDRGDVTERRYDLFEKLTRESSAFRDR
jgi:ribosome biogenesis GTPase